MPGRSYSRSKKGGAVSAEIDTLVKSLQQIQTDVNNAIENVKILENKCDKIEEQTLPEQQPQVKETDQDEDQDEKQEQNIDETENKSEETENNDVTNDEESDSDEDTEEKNTDNLDERELSINGFTGNVKDLKLTMKNKFKQLSGKKKYQDKAKKISDTMKLLDNAKNIIDVEKIIKENSSLTFKNNKLMGGKQTLKHKKRKGNKSKKNR